MSETKDAIDLMVEAMDAANPPANTDGDEGQTVEVEKVKAEEHPDSDEGDSGKDITQKLQDKAYKLREQKRQLKEQNAILAAELAELRGKAEKPDILDYENEEDFDKALKKHDEQSKGAKTVDVVLERAKAAIYEQHDEWDDAPEDWAEVVTDNKLPYDREMLAMFADLENGAEVMYALAKDEKALARIVTKISPVKRGLALDEFAKSLSTASVSDESQNVMNTNRTRKPGVSVINPVGGGSGKKASLESWSIEDHMNAGRNVSAF